MPRVVVIAEESRGIKELSSTLEEEGFSCLVASYGDEVETELSKKNLDLVLVELNGHSADLISELSRRLKREKTLPVLALVDKKKLDNVYLDSNIDDFALIGADVKELGLRMRRLINRTRDKKGRLIKCGDLVIDSTNYEVFLADRPVLLTFREYELLRFLASNPGRVFTRDDLLDKVWGYDYFGGDRTVDVHIRRLRSKIEDSEHTFIETVRNIGYRFKS